ncbi:MAG: hypothetical protein AAFR94_02630, partial [Pseudomonadota bacterium]
QLTLVNGANTVTAAALAKAESNIGTMYGVEGSGAVTQLTLVNGANTVTAAALADSCSSIGSIGKSC